MEESPITTACEDDWAQEITETLGQGRSRVREFLAAQRARLDEARTQLAEEIEQISQSLDLDHGETARVRQEIESRAESVQAQLDALTRLKQDLDARQARWEDAHREAIGQYQSLAERFHQEQSQVSEFSSQLTSQIDEQYRKLQQQTAELQTALAEQKQLLAEIEAGRGEGADLSELAERLQQQQKSQVAEFSSQLTSRIDEQYRKLQEQTGELQASLAGQKELLAEIEAGRGRESELNEQIEAFRRQCDQLREEAARTARDAGVDCGQLEALRAERDELAEQLRQQQKSQVAEFSSQLKARIDEQYEKLHGQTAELQAALAAQKELLAEIEAGRGRESELNEQIEALRRQYDQAREESSQAAESADADAGRLEHLQAELTERLRQQQESQIAEFTDRLKVQIDEQYQRLHEQTAELQIALAGQSELIAEVESGLRREAELKQQIETLRGECSQLREEASRAAGRREDGELEAVRAERDGLTTQISEMENRLMSAIDRFAETESRIATAVRGETGSDDGETDRRYQMAMEDLRELKTRNEELEEQLARAKESRPPAGVSGGGGLDWEAQKRRMLASLESDEDEGDEEEQARRLEVEEVVEKTDAIVAERDREIRELKQLLETQSATHNDLAVGAAALGEILDKDEVVREERDKLRRLQEEWEEKLRKAELEISVERAKVARERTQIEERLRVLEERGGAAGDGNQSGDSKEDGQPKRGRWLTRLGLKDP
jgi:DNA repair exonuclease SbcCD ATPase subunit